MNAYLNKTWWEYLLLVLLCVLMPLWISKTAPDVLLSFPSAISIWFFIAMPLLCGIMITIASKKLGIFDWSALVAMWLMLLLFGWILNGYSLNAANFPIQYALIVISFPVLETLLFGGIASIFVLHKKRKA